MSTNFEFRLALGVVALLALLAIFPEWIARYDPWATSGPVLGSPTAAHPFGSDALGRDTWTRMVYGARTSLLVGMLATGVALLIGGSVGLAAGTFGGWIDEGLMRLTEFLDAIPGLLLALLVVAVWGPGVVQISLAIGIGGWSSLARVLRVGLLSTREEDFVLAARSLGTSSTRIAFRHLLPHAFPPVLALVPFRIEAAIIAEASLSFLGLGDLAYPSWGGMLRDAQPFLRDAWWLAVGPGLLLLLTVFGLSLLADYLQRRAGPRSREDVARPSETVIM